MERGAQVESKFGFRTFVYVHYLDVQSNALLRAFLPYKFWNTAVKTCLQKHSSSKQAVLFRETLFRLIELKS